MFSCRWVNVPMATITASKFMNGKKLSSKTSMYIKYEIPSENMIAIIVMIVRNNDSVYSHIHSKTKRAPELMNQASRNRHSSNKTSFIPNSIATTDMPSYSKSILMIS